MPLSKKQLKKSISKLELKLKKDREYLLIIRDDVKSDCSEQEWIARMMCSPYSHFNKTWNKLIERLTKNR